MYMYMYMYLYHPKYGNTGRHCNSWSPQNSCGNPTLPHLMSGSHTGHWEREEREEEREKKERREGRREGEREGGRKGGRDEERGG